MAMNLLSPLSIINCLELLFAVVIGGIMGNMPVATKEASGSQIISATVYGYLIISAIVVICNIIKTDIPKNARLLIACSGAILYVTAGGLLIDSGIQYEEWYELLSSDWYERALAAGSICIIQVLIYMADGFFAFKSE